tara:strand:- start:175 stop:507 length:333 start_codon:yes stop_codon:yes gene_type:complete
MIKVNIDDIGGEVLKDNAQYLLKDNAFGNNLVLSSTFLRANRSTNGHTHSGQEEVYFFMKGKGEMQINEERFDVKKGDVVCIEDGDYHRVFNTSHLGLYFVCVFDGGRNH